MLFRTNHQRQFAEFIVQYELRNTSTPLPYFEPFAGLSPLAAYLQDHRVKQISDPHSDLIELWYALQNGWTPPDHCSHLHYELLRDLDFSSPERTWFGYVCSKHNTFFGPYDTKHTHIKHTKRAKQTILHTLSALASVHFLPSQAYTNHYLYHYLIYSKYPTYSTDRQLFWKTMRTWSEHNLVFVSVAKAPHDFVCIFHTSRNRLWMHQSKL